MFGIWSSKVVWHSWKKNSNNFLFSPMQKCIVLLKNHIAVQSVSRNSHFLLIWRNMKELMVQNFSGACLQCDKRFLLFDLLKQHKRSHVGEEPFNCTKCDKKFALGSDLKEHERTHTDEEPSSCLQCDKKFKHFGDMKQHWCNICSMRLFISYSSFIFINMDKTWL